MVSFIIRDVRIFTGDHTIPEGFVHITNGKIQAIGDISDLPKEPIETLSKPGHTLLPGLIDCHIHADKANPQALLQSLRFGVTTVCDMHNEIANVRKMKKLALEPDTASYKTAGEAATIKNGWPIPVILASDKSEETLAEISKWPQLSTLENVVEYLEHSKREVQPDYIKLMHESGAAMGMQLAKPTPELQKIIIDESKKRGYLTVAHALCLNDTIEVLGAGVNGLTHTFFDQPPTPELVSAYKKNNAWLNPTLSAIGSLTTEGKALQEKFAHDPRVEKLITEDAVGNMCRCMAMAIDSGAKVQFAYEGVKALREAGIDIVCGSDAAGPALGTAYGLTMHQELHIFVHEIGMSPEEALRSATSLVAKRFKFEDRGRLDVGLNADLLLVEGNPLEDIDATLNIRGVWRDGNLCTAHEEILPATP